MAEAESFLRWDLNRWLGALECIRQHIQRLSSETGATGVMLARVVQASCNDQPYGLP